MQVWRKKRRGRAGQGIALCGVGADPLVDEFGNRFLRGLLAGLPDLVEHEKVVSPALIVIGEVTARDDVALAVAAQEAAR